MYLIYKSTLGNVKFEGIEATYCNAEFFPGPSHRAENYANRLSGPRQPGEWAVTARHLPKAVNSRQWWELRDGRIVQCQDGKYIDDHGNFVTKTVNE